MTRTITAEMEAALDEPVIRPFLAVALDYDSGTTQATTLPIGVDVLIDGETYLGTGGLGRVSAASEDGETGAKRITVELSGVDPALLSIALQENYQGRRGTVSYGLLAEDHGVIDEPVIVFRGRMDTQPIELGSTASIQVNIESRLADWDRPRGGRLTDEEQKRRHPGDRFLEFVASTVEKDLVWGSGGGTSQPVVIQQSGGGGKK